jgi:hypothetical protein
MPAWEAHDPTLSRPIAAPLERCAELLGVDLDTIQQAAAHLEPYLRMDGTKVWTLMQLERRLHRPPPATDHRGPEPVTDPAGHCSFCGSMTGPFTKVEGLFTVLMCTDCQAGRGYGAGPYPVMTRAQMRESLELLPSWVLQQKTAANPPAHRGHAPAAGGW